MDIKKVGFTFRMYAKILFNRPLDKNKDYVSPGGYEMRMNGKTVAFDFCDYEGGIDPNNPSVVEFMQKNPDYDTFEDLNALTEEDLGRLEGIEEFYVYTGEDGESDLEPVMLLELGFRVIPMVGEIYDIDCAEVIPYFFKPLMTPEEFKKTMESIVSASIDEEDCHINMDRLMCELLAELGYADGVAVFKHTAKWYS